MEYGESVQEFKEFFRNQYIDDIENQLETYQGFIEISFKEMDAFNPELGDYLRDEPESAMNAAEEAILTVDIITDEEPIVRFKDMPREDYISLGGLRAKHVGSFVPVEGVVESAEHSQPKVISAIFECKMCGDRYEKEQDSSDLDSPYKCDCGSRNFEVEEKKLVNSQWIEFKGGRRVQVELDRDLVEKYQRLEGKKVQVNGIVGTSKRSGFTGLHYDIHANYLEMVSD